MAGGLVVVLLAVGSLGLPHDDLEEGDSPCLHRPCQHGVCEEDPGMQYGYRYLGHSISGTTMSKGYFRDTVSFILHRCFCEDGYTGHNCETDWDECWNEPCLNGGTCLDGIAHYNCSCLAGFSGNRCQTNVDDCLSDPCLHNGTCVDGVAGYLCHCHLGFRGDDCEIDIQVSKEGNLRLEVETIPGLQCEPSRR